MRVDHVIVYTKPWEFELCFLSEKFGVLARQTQVVTLARQSYQHHNINLLLFVTHGDRLNLQPVRGHHFVLEVVFELEAIVDPDVQELVRVHLR